MLVLSRKQNQSIVINGDIRVTVVSIRGNQVRIGIQAPDSVAIFREELVEPAAGGKNNHQLADACAVGGQAAPGSPSPLRRERAPRSVATR